MDILPIFYKANPNTHIVLVGEGEDAARKLRLISRSQARITIFAYYVNDEIQTQIDNNPAISYVYGSPTAQYLHNVDLVFCASECEAENESISVLCRTHNVPVNVVDTPHLSDFIVGGIVDRSPLVVSICTNGSAPIMVRNIRALLEVLLDKNLGKLCHFANGFRHQIMQKYPDDGRKRRRFWETFFNGTVAQDFLQGDKDIALKTTIKMLNSNALDTKYGEHIVIEVQDNDPNTLTIGDVKNLQRADIIVYPETTATSITEYFRRDAIRSNDTTLISAHVKQGDIVCQVHIKQSKQQIRNQFNIN